MQLEGAFKGNEKCHFYCLLYLFFPSFSLVWNLTFRCFQSPSRIKLSNVSFRNIRGTTSTQVVVKLVCDQGVPCQDVSLVTSTWNTTEMKALPCHNARTLSQIYWASNCQGLVPKMLNLLSKSEQIVLLLLYSYLFMFTRLLVYWWTRQKYNTRPLWKVCAVWSYEKKQMSIQTFFT